jgi:hypothetical protein
MALAPGGAYANRLASLFQSARRSAFRLRVAAAFFADAERAAAEREAEALPPIRPPLREDTWLSGTPRPEPLLPPPPLSLLTVAHARRSVSSSGTPRGIVNVP